MTPTPLPAITLERVPADTTDGARFYRHTGADIYRVTGRRIAGTVEAYLTTDHDGAPRVNQYVSDTRCVFPAVGLSISPDYADPGMRPAGEPRGSRPEPLEVNGRTYGDSATRYLSFYAVEHADGSPLKDGTRNGGRHWITSAADAAQWSYRWSPAIVGSDGVNYAGFWAVNLSIPGYGAQLTDAAQRVVEAIAFDLLPRVVSLPAVLNRYGAATRSTIDRQRDVIKSAEAAITDATDAGMRAVTNGRVNL